MKLVAVTSCPTGIAHSQMAAENLRTKGEEMGHDMSVEVQGAMGAQDELTSEEIAEADAVIIAADTAVSRDRFEGKPLVKGTVKDAVNDVESLIREAEELAESGETGETELQSGGSDADTDGESPSQSQSNDQKQVGGDPSKGLFARLKRLFS
ncbi:PTS system, fructose-specific IIB component [Halogranum rubrum]|uniref:PTS system, fructose-specific IIB component n=2 Tax=Halogranum rubrum TaxID=553466 RepID=A0A1I4IQL4_9EURY|nr:MULTISPECIES: PTS fructose transporter subunit IIB [Halogranum]EJN57088.1 phosphotransferase system IIB component [Halogranum salarium B-1]SFL56658.1 PTS system, fructose-specific IIB component [Halogranum rubrum]